MIPICLFISTAIKLVSHARVFSLLFVVVDLFCLVVVFLVVFFCFFVSLCVGVYFSSSSISLWSAFAGSVSSSLMYSWMS